MVVGGQFVMSDDLTEDWKKVENIFSLSGEPLVHISRD
jgi:hypothetical protein